MKPQLLLIGGGGHCKSVIDVIEQQDRYAIAGIIDRKERIGQEVLGYPIIGSDEELPALCPKYPNALITIGQITSPELRMELFRSLRAMGYALPTVISPRAYVSKHALVGEGSIIMHDAIVNACARIGENCIINSKALVEHDALVGDHCHISTGAILNGGTEVGEGSFVGSNAVSKEGAVIPRRSFIKAGSVIK